MALLLLGLLSRIASAGRFQTTHSTSFRVRTSRGSRRTAICHRQTIPGPSSVDQPQVRAERHGDELRDVRAKSTVRASLHRPAAVLVGEQHGHAGKHDDPDRPVDACRHRLRRHGRRPQAVCERRAQNRHVPRQHGGIRYVRAKLAPRRRGRHQLHTGAVRRRDRRSEGLDYARSGSQIRFDMLAESCSTQGLVAYYDFNAGTAGGIDTSIATVLSTNLEATRTAPSCNSSSRARSPISSAARARVPFDGQSRRLRRVRRHCQCDDVRPRRGIRIGRRALELRQVTWKCFGWASPDLPGIEASDWQRAALRQRAAWPSVAPPLVRCQRGFATHTSAWLPARTLTYK